MISFCKDFSESPLSAAVFDVRTVARRSFSSSSYHKLGQHVGIPEVRLLVVSGPSFLIARYLPPSSSFGAIRFHPEISVDSTGIDFVVIELFLET